MPIFSSALQVWIHLSTYLEHRSPYPPESGGTPTRSLHSTLQTHNWTSVTSRRFPNKFLSHTDLKSTSTRDRPPSLWVILGRHRLLTLHYSGTTIPGPVPLDPCLTVCLRWNPSFYEEVWTSDSSIYSPVFLFSTHTTNSKTWTRRTPASVVIDLLFLHPNPRPFVSVTWVKNYSIVVTTWIGMGTLGPFITVNFFVGVRKHKVFDRMTFIDRKGYTESIPGTHRGTNGHSSGLCLGHVRVRNRVCTNRLDEQGD